MATQFCVILKRMFDIGDFHPGIGVDTTSSVTTHKRGSKMDEARDESELRYGSWLFKEDEPSFNTMGRVDHKIERRK